MSDLKTDPRADDIFLPDQVRRQKERADELFRELTGEETDPAEPVGAAEASESPSSQDATTGSEAQLELPLEGGSGTPPPPTAAPSDSGWEQRYRTLQGKYDSEIGGLRGQVASMERLLATMQHPPQPQAPAPQQLSLAFNEEDVELYGEEMLQAASRAAESRYSGEITELRNKLSQLSGAAEQDRVFRELDSDPELRGRWRQLNEDQGFITWLQGIDDLSGAPRNAMLQHAYQHGDAMRTGRFFKAYMAEHTVPSPQPQPPQTGAPARPNGGNGYAPAGSGPRLEELAVPGRAAGSGAGNGAPQSRLWSRPEITAFYRARTRGEYRGREAEAEALEHDLLRAEREGRLV